MGKPVVGGTRITVELILEKLGSGETIDQPPDAHPRLTRGAVLVALEFAAGRFEPMWDIRSRVTINEPALRLLFKQPSWL